MRPTAIITGASRGIGAAVLRRFSDSHDCIVLGLTRPQHCTMFIKEDLAEGPTVAAACQELAEYLTSRGVTPEVLVNNAGGAQPATAMAITPDHIQRDLTLNLVAPMMLTRVVLEPMRAAGQGSIVNVSSTAAKPGVAYLPAYSAANAGLIAYTQSLAAEVGPFGVRANCVCPGAVDTAGADDGRREISRLHGLRPDEYQAAMARRTGLGRLLEPDEVADVIYWLALAGRAVNGQAINVCGTLTMG